jgi:hypothetical protein
MKKTIFAIILVALLGTAPASAQVDLSNFVALGDGMTGGLANAGLMDCYQQLSWPAVVAEQAGSPFFEMPLISPPGLPPTLELVSLAGGVPVLEPSGDIADAFPYNITYELPYNNLGIPTLDIYDVLFATGDATNIATGNINPDTLMFDLILRIPQVQDPSTGELIDFVPIAQAAALQPSFLSFWVGMEDVLLAVMSATPIEGITMRPVDGPVGFASLYGQAVGGMVSLMPNTQIVLMTLPDVTEVAFATTVSPFLEIPGLGAVPIIGTNGPLTPADRVTLLGSELLAQGYGLPLPNSPPLPEDLNLATGEPGYVLRAEEIAQIKAQVAAYNAAIEAVAANFNLPVFDAGAVLNRMNAGEGYVYGGVHFTGEFLLGGLIGYDGIYTQQIGQAIFADEFIEYLNSTMNAGLTPIDMSEILLNNPCADTAVPAGANPKDVVFSKEARRYLLDYLAPELGRIRQQQENTPSASD